MSFRIAWGKVPKDILTESKNLKKAELYWISKGGRSKEAYDIANELKAKRMAILKPYRIEIEFSSERYIHTKKTI